MMCKYFTSQTGLSLFKLLFLIVIVAIVLIAAALYFIPRNLTGDTLAIVNQLGDKTKNTINNLVGKLSGVGQQLSTTWDSVKTKLARKLEDLLDRWNLKNLSKLIAGVEEKWEEDMETLISVSKSRGFDMSQVDRRRDEYVAGNVSWRRVEAEYWEEIRKQTEESVTKSIERFRTRPLGCSDFTQQLLIIWDITQEFNKDTFEGYDNTKRLSEELQNPGSVDFLKDILKWLGYQEGNWFVQRLQQAIDTSAGVPNYPEIIKQIDAHVNTSHHPFGRVLDDITVAEIYLNYDLINPAEERYDEAIRNLAPIVARYDGNRYPYQAFGLHMALGLLYERVCKNNDLAIKEFKDVIALGRRLGLPCQDYSIAHYHLGIINLKLREGKQVKPQFETVPSTYTQPTQELWIATPIPTPSPIPTPTPKPPIEVGVSIKIPRTITEEPGREERPVPEIPEETPQPVPTPPTYIDTGVIKGTLAPGQQRIERDIRLRPRTEVGDTRKMKEFKIDDLYDLTSIPDDAAREFEFYLKCFSQGARVNIARFIHDKYLGK